MYHAFSMKTDTYVAYDTSLSKALAEITAKVVELEKKSDFIEANIRIDYPTQEYGPEYVVTLFVSDTR